MEGTAVKVVCIGDSFTRGFKIKASESWASILGERPGLEVHNLGINGDSTAGMLSRFQRDVTDAAPSRVIITGGVNDLILRVSPDAACSNVATMVHHARHYRITPLIGIEPPVIPDMAETFWPEVTDFWRVNLELAELRLKLLAFAKAFKVETVDFYSRMEAYGGERKELYSDGLHLMAEGNRLMAEAITLG
jgi:lysophospholipase L1-like esterase